MDLPGDLTAMFGTNNATEESMREKQIKKASGADFRHNSSKLNSRRQIYANDVTSINSSNALEKPVSSLKTRLHQTMLIQKELMDSQPLATTQELKNFKNKEMKTLMGKTQSNNHKYLKPRLGSAVMAFGNRNSKRPTSRSSH